MLVEPKDLAVALGMNYETLRKHITRKKLFKSGKLVDLNFEPNKEYIVEQTNGKGLDYTKLPKRETATPKKSKIPSPNVDLNEVETSGPSNPEDSGLAMEKRKLEIEKLKSQIREVNFKHTKNLGEYLPTELVEKIFTINIQTIFRNFESEAENVATIYCDILGDRSKIAEMTKKMRESLQMSINDAKASARKDIKKEIIRYVQKKEGRESQIIDKQLKLNNIN